jgi:hypothetical protein
MSGCKPCTTPIDTNAKLSADGPPVADATDYRALAGALQRLTFTRPDISYAVQQICLYMHDPREPHLALIKRVLRYIKGTLDYGLKILQSSTSDLVAYSDADWAVVPILDDLPQVTMYFLVTIWFLGLRSDNKRFLSPVLRPNIELLPMQSRNFLGFDNFFRNFISAVSAPP